MKKYAPIHVGTRWATDHTWGVMVEGIGRPAAELLCVGCTQAQAEGTLSALIDAGAELLPNACGACAGYGAGRFDDGIRVIASTARNFKGRMGAASSRIWLGSPYTVAAAAVTGRITDPRLLLDRYADDAAGVERSYQRVHERTDHG